MNDFSGEPLKRHLVAGIGLLLAIVLGCFIGSSDYRPILLIAFAIAGVTLWFGLGEWFWAITIASSYLAGTFPILGGSFNTFQILMAIGVGKFLIEEVVMRRTRFAKVDRPLLLSMLGFMAIVTWHGIHDRFGMRFLGSSVWGGRNYINVYVGIVAFFVIQSVPQKTAVWTKLPYLVLAVNGFDLLIASVTTLFPASIFKIYPFYSAVGVAGIAELTTGQEDITGRVGALGTFGFYLVLVILAGCSFRRLFHLSNLVRLTGLAVGGLAVLYSGFRSAVFNTAAALMVAAARDLKAGVFLLLPLLAALLVGLSFVNSVIPLPKQVQRSLTFMPGDWDADMASNAAASNDFRGRVWTIWLKEYFPHQPLLGRGFGFKSDWVQADVSRFGKQDYQQMVEVGNIHNGLFAALDAVGIIGTLFFFVWTLQLLWSALRSSFESMGSTKFTLRFISLQLAVSTLTYWLGAVTLGTFLPGAFALAGLLFRLKTDGKRELLSTGVSSRAIESKQEQVALFSER